ncbi:MAG: hypothetical protein ABF238_00960 [Flavobacteriales bacterium]
MNLLKFGLIILFVGIYSCIFGQEEEKSIKKFRFGIDLGLDFPNQRYAQFLDGSHPFGVNRILTNPQTRQQLQDKLGYPIKSWEFSRNNEYPASFFSGVFLGFDISSDWAVVMKFDIGIIRFSTPLVIALDNPQNFTGEFEQATVTARERRFGYKLGVQKNIEIQPKLNYYISPGAGFNYIQLENQELVIRSVKYNITRVQNSGLNFQRVDGFGYGFYLDNGMSYILNEKFTIAFGIEGRIQKNQEYVERLTEGTTYLFQNIEKAKKFAPSAGVYFRLLWN